MRIISGAQTGVDRAALDEAMAIGLPVSGWCPQGRRAEDGVIPARYPVEELAQAGYRQRTRKNVMDSDGTAIFYVEYPTGGTQLTLKYCIDAKRPYLLIDVRELSVERAARRLAKFIGDNAIGVLNVAGPRAGGAPTAYAYVRQAMRLCFATTHPQP